MLQISKYYKGLLLFAFRQSQVTALQGGRNEGRTSQQRPHQRALPEDDDMTETENSGSPAPKKDEEEILDLINEMTQNLDTDSDVILLPAEMPPSGDKEEDDIIMLNTGGLHAEATDEQPIELSEEILDSETYGEDILELSDDASLMAETEKDLLTLSDEVSSASEEADDIDDILDLDDEAMLMEETDADVVTLSDEVTSVAEEADNFLDLGTVESLLAETGQESAAVSGNTSASRISNKNQFDMSELPTSLSDDYDINELPTLLSEDLSETDTVLGEGASKGVQHAKDLVQDGFELGEALDAVIDKEIVADNDLVAALGLGLEYEPAAEARTDRFDSGVPSVSSAQLEAAIERVMDRMLGRKIDQLLATAIEKAVTHEIKRLKRLLSETLPDS